MTYHADTYDHHEYLDPEVNLEKQQELDSLANWLSGLLPMKDLTSAVSLLSAVWSEEQGVFGYEVGRHETVYYKTWYVNHDRGQFRFENMALNSDGGVFYDDLGEGLKRLGI